MFFWKTLLEEHRGCFNFERKLEGQSAFLWQIELSIEQWIDKYLITVYISKCSTAKFHLIEALSLE